MAKKKDPKKIKGRRKSKDIYKVTPALIAKVGRLAGKGLQNNQIAVSLGWSEATYYKTKAENPEFAEAIKKGELKDVREAVNSLSKRVRGYEYEETTIETEDITDKETGVIIATKTKTKKTIKQLAPDTTAIIFKLVNRDPENWKHKSEQKVEGSLQVEMGPITKNDAETVKSVFDDITK